MVETNKILHSVSGNWYSYNSSGDKSSHMGNDTAIYGPVYSIS